MGVAIPYAVELLFYCRSEITMGDQLTTLRWEALSAHPALPMGPSVHRPSARLYSSWVWGITCVKELRLQSQRSSLNLELNLRQLSLLAPTACTA